ncbi:MAG TPA: hypothetical protein VFX81_09220 [Burkholderiaceae bacterium]|nr:hypothetical protein [Burkholderiaceae bacterium]
MPTAAALQQALRSVRASFGAAAESDKRRLLTALADRRLPRTGTLVAYHEDLLFVVAFPGSMDVRNAALDELRAFGARVRALGAAQRAALSGTGLAGTVSRYGAAHPIAEALVDDDPRAIELDWSNVDDPVRLDELIAQVLTEVERESFGVDMPSRRWVDAARRADAVSTLQWLLRAAAGAPPAVRKGFGAAWDQTEVPVRWKLGESKRAVTHNRIELPQPVLRTGFRKLDEPLVRRIERPLGPIRRLGREPALRVIDVARSALAARCREVHAMNYANPDEVHLAELGEGVQLAVIGVLTSHRLLLEANYGYVLLANGVPVGYGGVSPLFRQANTGINVFDPFRGSEATFLWAQTLRAFRTLFGVRRFIVNGYQFGAGNAEAISSGAYWFYYRLGFRPSSAENRALAEAEDARLRRDGGRSSPATLRRLATGDLHLDLSDWDPVDAFEESALDHVGTVLARRLADVPVWSRSEAARALAREVEAACAARPARWPRAERAAFERLAPLAALLPALPAWSSAERRSLGALLRAKGGTGERDFAQQATACPRFYRELASVLLGSARPAGRAAR